MDENDVECYLEQLVDVRGNCMFEDGDLLITTKVALLPPLVNAEAVFTLEQLNYFVADPTGGRIHEHSPSKEIGDHWCKLLPEVLRIAQNKIDTYTMLGFTSW